MPKNEPRLPILDAYRFAEVHGLGEQAKRIRTKRVGWKSYTTSVRRGWMILLLESRGLFDEFCSKYWPYQQTNWGKRMYRRHLKLVLQTNGLDD